MVTFWFIWITSFIYFKEVILVLFSFYVFLYKVLHFHFLFIFVFMIFILKVFPCNSKVIKPFDLFNLLEQLENLLMICLNPLYSHLVAKQERKEKLGV